MQVMHGERSQHEAVLQSKRGTTAVKVRHDCSQNANVVNTSSDGGSILFKTQVDYTLSLICTVCVHI